MTKDQIPVTGGAPNGDGRGATNRGAWSWITGHSRRWRVVATAAALLGVSAAGGWAYSFYSCGSNCTPRWPPGRIALYANQEATDCDLAALERAIAQWNAALAQVGADVQVALAGRTAHYGLQKNGLSTVALLVGRWPKERRLFGWTSIWWRSGRIVEGDIVFNLQHHRFRCDIPVRRGHTTSLEQEMMHELGHFLGLDHGRVGIMAPVGYAAAVDPDALEGLRALYGP